MALALTATSTPTYLWLALVLSACGHESTPTRRSTVEVQVDDGPTRLVRIEQVIPLASIVEPPVSAWLAVRADTQDDRSIDLPRNSGEIRMYVDQGRPAIGVFPPITPDMPQEIAALARQPTMSLAGIATVHVLTRRLSLPSIVVEIDGTARSLAGETLRALPGVVDRRIQGWPILDVIKLASDRTATSLRIVGADTLTLETLDPTRIYVLKLNQRGEYVFRVWESGGRHPLREVRRVAKIVIP
jgi:hypothetical protein